MTPAQALADLNASLSRSGEDIKIFRASALAATGVTCRAFVRGYQPDELIGGITQHDAKVILSPTQIIDTGWTSARPVHEDTRVPLKGDRVVIAGRPRTIEAVGPIYMNGELVRIELRVTG